MEPTEMKINNHETEPQQQKNVAKQNKTKTYQGKKKKKKNEKETAEIDSTKMKLQMLRMIISCSFFVFLLSCFPYVHSYLHVFTDFTLGNSGISFEIRMSV